MRELVRLPKNSQYWYLVTNATGTRLIVETAWDFWHEVDDKRFAVGNYFPSEAKAVMRKEGLIFEMLLND